MADDKSRSRRRISIDGAGIERRRTAIQTLVDQAPQPRAGRATTPGPIFGASPDGIADASPGDNTDASPDGIVGAGPDNTETPRLPVQGR